MIFGQSFMINGIFREQTSVHIEDPCGSICLQRCQRLKIKNPNYYARLRSVPYQHLEITPFIY